MGLEQDDLNLVVGTAAWGRARLLVRLHECLRALIDDPMLLRAWMHGAQEGLGGIPLAVAQERDGLQRVLDHVEALLVAAGRASVESKPRRRRRQ